MLMAGDAQLDQISTPLGAVSFVQVFLFFKLKFLIEAISLYFSSVC